MRGFVRKFPACVGLQHVACNRQKRFLRKMSCVGLLSSQLEVWLTMCLLQAAGMIDCMGLARKGEGWRPSRCRKFVEG